MNNDRVEFYTGDRLIVGLASSIVPTVGSKINIKKITYTVEQITYAVDYSDRALERSMRVNVELILSDKVWEKVSAEEIKEAVVNKIFRIPANPS